MLSRILLLAVICGLMMPVGAWAGRCVERGGEVSAAAGHCCTQDEASAGPAHDGAGMPAGLMGAACCCVLVLAVDTGAVATTATLVRDLDIDEPAEFAGLNLRPTPPPPRA